MADDTTVRGLAATNQIALTYATSDGAPAEGKYPANPNGSVADIAGVCDATGAGPRPDASPGEPRDHPPTPPLPRGERHGLALALFTNAVTQVGATV